MVLAKIVRYAFQFLLFVFCLVKLKKPNHNTSKKTEKPKMLLCVICQYWYIILLTISPEKAL